MSHRAGYSLFEVLLAFAIMAMVLAAVLPQQAGLLGRATQVNAQQLAQDYALSRIDRLGVSDPLRPGRSSEIYRDWTVALDISPFRLSALPGRRLLRVEITVSTKTGRELARVDTLRAAP